MSELSLRRLAGGLLIVVPVVFTLCFTLLGMNFDYPGILRQPTDTILRGFVQGGTGLLMTWYTLTLSAILFIPVAVTMHQVLARTAAPAYLWLGTTFGVLAGLVQTLGFIRWPFLVPHLAAVYVNPGASEAQRQAAAVVFEAFHIYAGVAIGEHMGYLFTSLWTVLIALVMLRTGLVRPWLSWIGVVLGVGIFAGLFEMAGLEVAGTINAMSYLAWSVWLIVVGVLLLRSSVSAAQLKLNPATK